ncbi:MAG: rhodanese-like domain-containing protein [Chloroflexia bacterium]
MTANRAQRRVSLLVPIGLALLSTLTACAAPGTATPTQTPPTPSPTARVGALVKTSYGSYMNVEPSDLKSMLVHKDFYLVDVHTPPEGRLPDTDARIPYDQIEGQVAKLPADKRAKIVFTCYSGAMSSIASETLVRLGYTNVYNLNGGMAAWRAAGYQIIPEAK